MIAVIHNRKVKNKLGMVLMEKSNDNVIMFPKWKKTLEDESLHALKEKRYVDALEKLNILLDHDVTNHDVMTGKIICLIELGKYEDAEEICLQLLAAKDENYFPYLHIYLTLLFQTSQYQELIERLDDTFETEDIPEPIREQLVQLYDMSEKLYQETKEENSLNYLQELHDAIKEKETFKQWRILVKCRKLDISPYLGQLKELLVSEEIHPVIKTSIMQWLQEQKVNQNIEIHKLGIKKYINPSRLQDIYSHHVTKQILLLLNDIEQHNPSLFELIEKLLYRYLFIRYPLMPLDEELSFISKALKFLGEDYLQLKENKVGEGAEDDKEKVDYYIKEIELSEKQYFTVLDE